jgi:hypothetical protein
VLANPAAEGGTMGEKWPRILPKVATSTSLLGSFTFCGLISILAVLAIGVLLARFRNMLLNIGLYTNCYYVKEL